MILTLGSIAVDQNWNRKLIIVIIFSWLKSGVKHIFFFSKKSFQKLHHHFLISNLCLFLLLSIFFICNVFVRIFTFTHLNNLLIVLKPQVGEILYEVVFELLKVAQNNYVSRNQLHCTANLNFGLMCKMCKTLLGFVNKPFYYVQLIIFLDQALLLAELAQKFKLLQNSCMVK